MTVTETAAPHVDRISEILGRLQWKVAGLGQSRIAAFERRSVSSSNAAFHYLQAGIVRVEVGGESHRLLAGDFVFIARGAEHELSAEEDAILFTGMIPAGVGAQLDRRLPPLLVACGLRAHNPLVETLVTAMASELEASRPGAASVVSQLANLVTTAALRAWVERGCAAADWLVNAPDPDVSLALEAIHADPGHPWTVAGLARVARSSRSIFSERFHATVGDPPLRYLSRVRMDRAMHLLERERLSVAQTAAALGYGSDVAFSRAFRRHTGMAPSAWLSSRRTVAAVR